MHGSSTQKFFTVLQLRLPLFEHLDLVGDIKSQLRMHRLSIAKEQLKGKLTVVPIKNPNDNEMLKVFREYFFLLDQLVVKYYSITRVWPLI